MNVVGWVEKRREGKRRAEERREEKGREEQRREGKGREEKIREEKRRELREEFSEYSLGWHLKIVEVH